MNISEVLFKEITDKFLQKWSLYIKLLISEDELQYFLAWGKSL